MFPRSKHEPARARKWLRLMTCRCDGRSNMKPKPACRCAFPTEPVISVPPFLILPEFPHVIEGKADGGLVVCCPLRKSIAGRLRLATRRMGPTVFDSNGFAMARLPNNPLSRSDRPVDTSAQYLRTVLPVCADPPVYPASSFCKEYSGHIYGHAPGLWTLLFFFCFQASVDRQGGESRPASDKAPEITKHVVTAKACR